MPYTTVNANVAGGAPGGSNAADPTASQAAGFTKANAAARSASGHRSMNPLKNPNVLINYLARMLPLDTYQHAVYRLGQKHPPGFEDGFCPMWEVATAILPARQTTQLRINFQREFHLIGTMASSSLAGGFRAQLYDTKKQYVQGTKPGVRLAARGVNHVNYFGGTAALLAFGTQPFFIREPHPFTEPDAQALVIIQNQDTSASNNNIQVALYGVVRRFNWPD
jgi:hypothetical protein